MRIVNHMGVAGEQLPPGKAEDITIASPLKGGGRNRFKVKIKNTKPMIIQNCCVIKKDSYFRNCQALGVPHQRWGLSTENYK